MGRFPGRNLPEFSCIWSQGPAAQQPTAGLHQSSFNDARHIYRLEKTGKDTDPGSPDSQTNGFPGERTKSPTPLQGHRPLRPPISHLSFCTFLYSFPPTFAIKRFGRSQLMADLAASAVARSKAVTESCAKSTAAWFRWQSLSPADRHLRRLPLILLPRRQVRYTRRLQFRRLRMGDFSVAAQGMVQGSISDSLGAVAERCSSQPTTQDSTTGALHSTTDHERSQRRPPRASFSNS
jgi:hypothetical protein